MARDPRRQRTIDALLKAAEEVFAERPAEDVTVEEIAERAGVSVGSIYNSFGSKAGLHAAVVDRALDVDREYMDRAYTPQRSPIQQLEAAAEQYLRFALEQPQFFRMLAFPAALGNYPAAAETAARLAHRVDEQNARMIDAIERGIADGTIRELDARKAATVLWASWNGVISLAWRPDELREDEQGLAELLSLAADIVSWGLRQAEGKPGS
ncbi:TetR/AcrR family transcriptional regulator [Amycolatopsis sp. K13G38]|uniref:TetR/AcrR family transcriptional regulator n=1 Tax=Amycolatopsis acididurans TaxID=2724524 RepID=A0ABX1JJ03_9PSEU|nr:TetR/AcrR family transcriptional regulator [Amycolatopsis acididurans]NKQ58420.1 TetR/AcrR family transcriptional regulator [Amycolatopsis acididurans]